MVEFSDSFDPGAGLAPDGHGPRIYEAFFSTKVDGHRHRPSACAEPSIETHHGRMQGGQPLLMGPTPPLGCRFSFTDAGRLRRYNTDSQQRPPR